MSDHFYDSVTHSAWQLRVAFCAPQENHSILHSGQIHIYEPNPICKQRIIAKCHDIFIQIQIGVNKTGRVRSNARAFFDHHFHYE